MWVIKSDRGYLYDQDLENGYIFDINQAILYSRKREVHQVIENGRQAGSFPEEWAVKVEVIGVKEVEK